jgi:serine/threonine protein kinase
MATRSPSEARPFPERVGRYEVLLPIGAGGMATVYLARARGVGGFEREVALKLAHAHIATEPDFASNLLAEARVASRIRHANVVPVLDVGEEPIGVFLVMDYIEGDSLSALMKRARSTGDPIPLRVALRVLADALSGLHAAHELQAEDGASLGLVHRDFSPQNLLVGTDGVTRLTDFGIAKAANHVAFTRSGLIKGKIGYVSPEQVRSKDVDQRSDVWSAGVVAWELIAGRRLYPPGEDLATLLRIVSEKPPRVRSVRPEAPELLDEVIAQALEPDLRKRLPTARELRQRLVDAAPAIGGIAEPAEVSVYLSGRVRDMLEDRRARVASVLDLREKMGALARVAVESPSPSSSPSDVYEASLDVTQREAVPEPLRRAASSRSRLTWRVGLAVGAAAGAVAILSQLRAAAPSARSAATDRDPLAVTAEPLPLSPPTAVASPSLEAPSEVGPADPLPTRAPVRRAAPPKRALAQTQPPRVASSASVGRPPPLKNPFGGDEP